MPDDWQPIVLSAKVFGHLSQGLYRTPAGAIKELISNSFDADATLVRIHTGFPRFDTFSCEDNGTGMSVDEFRRLMDQGIGSSYKRTASAPVTMLKRPLIGRLGLGILALAQICNRFDIVSHHKESKTGFRATIKFPPYTREDMDKIAKSSKGEELVQIPGGEYRIFLQNYDSSKQGVRVSTEYLRETFRKRMRAQKRLANKLVFKKSAPYRTYDNFLDAIYSRPSITRSLNLTSDYDQLLFGLALAPPLPLIEQRNVAVNLPSIRKRQAQIRDFNFNVKVDNLSLYNPVCLPSDLDAHTADHCHIVGSEKKPFQLIDGPVVEECTVVQHRVAVDKFDATFNLYEFQYINRNVAGMPLSFDGYLFQQSGRLYPRDIQGVLIRLNNVAIGKYDSGMLTYPYAEGPRYSMVSSELFIRSGFEDALNIDRDSFNELHPHFIRVQSYIHALLHDLIFPETWMEEKGRNKQRRARAEQQRDSRFLDAYREKTGDSVRSIRRLEKPRKGETPKAVAQAPVDFGDRGNRVEIDRAHPLLQPLFRRRKYASLVEKVVLAFERSNQESGATRRRELFYKLLVEIFSDL